MTANFIFKSKAQTLEKLLLKLTYFQIPPFVYFTVKQCTQELDLVICEIKKRFFSRTVVVRSSAGDEDGALMARAGEYDSVLDVTADDPGVIRDAISSVITGYQQKGGTPSDGDEVIVQQMLQNTSMSGVVFTHDLNTGAPYYVINYDDVTGLTNTVTSGAGEYANRTLCIHRSATQALRSDRFKRLMLAIHELETVTDSQFLDVEFAIGQDLTPYLLQVRAITTQPNWNRAVAKRIDAALQGIQAFARARFQPMLGVFGQTTVLGQMPDWNPAEMIGRAPRALAFSLYKVLITDHAWRIARETMGYTVPTGQPLMISLAGQPFIDTRLSFHSFLPATLSPAISQKLVDVWIKRLRDNPELHDKVEFDVAITTYSFDIDEKMEVLTGGLLNDQERSEFKEARKQQTLEHLKDSIRGGISTALSRIGELAEKQKSFNLDPKKSDIKALFGMIDDCIRLGTVPFAILARHAFIARTLLLSLHRRGIFSMEEIHQFQSSIRTVASDLVEHMRCLRCGELSTSQFMEIYGHLRPGTYDILSLRYDQMENFTLGDVPLRVAKEIQDFSLLPTQRQAINHLLEVEGFKGVNVDSLFTYIRKATAGREYGKFVFSRTLSNMLEMIAAYGEQNGLSRGEMSHISVGYLLEVATTSDEDSIEDRLRRKAEDGADQHVLSRAIRLPQVLFDEAGVHVIPFQVSHPNFITNKQVTAACVVLYSDQTPPSLAGKIILIESADPGFDWIFAHPIAGLITEYGGANSHMAIRCAEFGIPAAIGCGEQRFNQLTKAEQIMLDCSSSLIQILH